MTEFYYVKGVILWFGSHKIFQEKWIYKKDLWISSWYLAISYSSVDGFYLGPVP